MILNHRGGLQNMYGKKQDELDKSLEDPIKRREEMDRNLITEMECGVEITKDSTVLRPYELAILIGIFRC